LETVKLADSLTFLVEKLGPKDPVVQQLLAGQSPQERAFQAIRGSKLADPAFRKTCYGSSPEKLRELEDPMIELARTVDQAAREVRKTFEANREAIRQAHAAIGKARYALSGATQYPDATSTLRLTFGVVKPYEEAGKTVPTETFIGGMFRRWSEHNGEPPFDLPPRWLEKQKKLNANTPFNFISTADIIGGNSGSPVVDRDGRFVGLIFDGNIQSLVTDFIYTEEQARAVSVHPAAIVEGLRKVYKADPLGGRTRWP
jgi:hypothetical protein